ncbi:MAG: hypothetical protein NTW14_03965 [bacterium]|nr:hypothetical protein [bacterium]
MANNHDISQISRTEKNIRNIWEVFAWLDKCRWSADTNSSSINYINYKYPDMRPEQKILTHWLSYITDRQMGFRLIWDKGSYVLSEIVHQYTSQTGKSSQEVLRNHIKTSNVESDHEQNKYSIFIEIKNDNSNLLEEVYGAKKGETVTFSGSSLF